MIEKKLSFAQTSKLGYITSSPSNLGTGLRASVHIELPNLGRELLEFSDIVDRYHLQIGRSDSEREAHHIYDISNRRSLGRTEVEIVENLYEGVTALIKREKELASRTFFDFTARLLDSDELVSVDRFSRYAVATIVVNVATE